MRLSADTLGLNAQPLPVRQQRHIVVVPARAAAVSVAGFIDLENVITTCPFSPIPVAPFTGVTDTTVGGVVSAVVAVVKLTVASTARGCPPDRTRTP